MAEHRKTNDNNENYLLKDRVGITAAKEAKIDFSSTLRLVFI